MMQVLTPTIPKDLRFGLLRVRSPLLAESRLMSFPAPTEMFQFRAFPSYGYLIHRTIPEYCSGVLPHSDISGSMLICSSPKLFAACRVLHRLLMPRHSPCALISFTSVMISHNRFSELCRFQQKVLHKIVFTLKLKVPQLLFKV